MKDIAAALLALTFATPRSRAHPKKLTGAIALAVYRDTRTHKAIAAEHGISASAVSQIKNGGAWARVTGAKGKA